MTCTNCGAPMTALFTSMVCSAECDLRPAGISIETEWWAPKELEGKRVYYTAGVDIGPVYFTSAIFAWSPDDPNRVLYQVYEHIERVDS